jgi:hypothetical protein
MHLDDWLEFSEAMKRHILKTETGHYVHSKVGTMDLIEGMVGDTFALGNVVKYVSRYPYTSKEEDLLKAAHYLSRAWALKQEEAE